ncbi:MAG: ABC transporter permease [Candidatus Omnitrophica bacterium]|nr:ABC transporter permease [Candidatus Omnitrophota bacterium]MBU1631016.1 ABC transporter permease [Candidatus Omnitrophota bacterium]MBU1766511.1 ABC transporter permease [Candidatus Omnitrophota bacterium]MBU1888680.1 ABC transporter permease [Candidatus Omnitrophota bacterium]
MKSKGKRFLSFATFISILGIALGVAAIIVVMGVMNGFSEEIRNKILGLKPHIVVNMFSPDSNGLSSTIEKIEQVDGVVASSPVLWGEGILQCRERAKGIIIKGIDFQKEIKVTDLKKYIKPVLMDEFVLEPQKNAAELADLDGGILIGEELAKGLGLFDYDEVSLISTQLKVKKFKVKGFFNSGMYEYDNSLVFLSLEDARDLLGLGSEYDGIQVKIEDVFKAPAVKEKLQVLLGPASIVRTWQETDRTLFEALKLEKIAMFTILTLIVIVASFNIASTLIVMVMEKKRQIGILKAIGATSADIRKIFLYQGLIIGFCGAVLGCLVGLVLGILLKKYHFIALSEEIYSMPYLPIKLEWTMFAVVGLLALFICLLATIYPASRASKLTVGETLRYE